MVRNSSSKILQIPHDSNSRNGSNMASKARSNDKKQYKGATLRASLQQQVDDPGGVVVEA
ncbi:hypothetical protein Cni_G01879 [Canna indica]|uniref:Uncharacterized protein n=1 Tax=Canna indica TaxID=4628 RepID=A0AAQ3JRJ6_9LILI|nr:hypothetical protein Cni_G01879 [Canna indica]